MKAMIVNFETIKTTPSKKIIDNNNFNDKKPERSQKKKIQVILTCDKSG